MSHPTPTPESRRLVHQGRIFRLEVDRVQLPSGHTVDMEIIRHPGSVVLLPIADDGRIVLIRQYRYSIDRWIWELPAGSLKPSEDPEAAARRECEEEIGLVPDRIDRLCHLYPTPGFCDEVMIFYRCSALRPPDPESTAQKDEDEVIEPRAMSIAEAWALVDSGDIVDMKTVVGLTLLK